LGFAELLSSVLRKDEVCEYLNDKKQALDSFYDALLDEEKNSELNRNMGNYYLSNKDLVPVILHWARYLENSSHEEEYFSILGAAKILFSPAEDKEPAEAGFWPFPRAKLEPLYSLP
jgi:hypothetical protein